MTPRRRSLAIAAAFAAVLAGASIALWPRPAERSPAAIARPEARTRLMLLTSLPLLFGEDFGLGAIGSPTLDRLERDYDVRPIAAAEPASLAGGRLLLMAHPRAQPAELLVALDRWVRGGGQLLLLADPKLNWPSSKPLGDPLRPPSAFADTGLLLHWGLALDGPQPDGPATLEVGGRQLATASPGRLRLAGKGRCALEAAGFVARCAVGKGRVVVIADADFLNVGTGADALDGPTADNLGLLADELEGLARSR